MNRVLNVSSVLRDLFPADLGIEDPIQSIEFIGHTQPDVYRVKVAGGSFIVYADPHERQRLRELRLNLQRLAALEDERIPRVAAWRESEGKPAWSLVVCHEIEGRELERRNASDQVLDSLGELLWRLHSLSGIANDLDGPSRAIHDPKSFPAFADSLLTRLSDLPVRFSRVRRHCDEMGAFVKANLTAYDRPPHLIHGDLHRSNIIVSGDRIGLIDWFGLASGDYAFDLGALKLVLDSVRPAVSAAFIRRLARRYRDQFDDRTLEVRLRYYMALAGLVRAFDCAEDASSFRPGRAWRVRASYHHSEVQWRNPLRLDGEKIGAPAARTEEWALDMRQPLRGLFYLVAPRRIA